MCLFPHTTTTNLIFFTYFSNNNFLRKNQQFSAKTTKNKNKNARIITFYNQKLKRLMTVNGSNLKSINFCVTNHIKKKDKKCKTNISIEKKNTTFFFRENNTTTTTTTNYFFCYMIKTCIVRNPDPPHIVFCPS